MYLLNLAILFIPWTYCSTLAIKNNSKYFSMHFALLTTRTQNYYRPERSCGQGNIFKPVCHSFYSQGGRGSASVHAGIPPPGSRHTTPGADTPGSRPPRSRPPWTPRSRHPPPKSRYPPGADTHPPRSRPPWEQTPTPPGADPTRKQTPAYMVYERPVCILLECILVLI